MIETIKQCGTCRHMFEQLTDPRAIGETRHECREGPPQMLVVAPGQVMVKFPPVSEKMVPCGRWMSALTDAANG